MQPIGLDRCRRNRARLLLAEACRPMRATTTLAARRFRSTVKSTPGSVSSKSLTSNRILSSGVTNAPKFMRWLSPPACTGNPTIGWPARSVAITAAAPRKKANGLTVIRLYRSGTSSGTRSGSLSARIATALRAIDPFRSACASRGVLWRSSLPCLKRSAREPEVTAICKSFNEKATSHNTWSLYTILAACHRARARHRHRSAPAVERAAAFVRGADIVQLSFRVSKQCVKPDAMWRRPGGRQNRILRQKPPKAGQHGPTAPKTRPRLWTI